jgi:DNA-binding protein HU-beta
MATLNKSDLAGLVAAESGLSGGDAKAAVEKTFAVIAQRLSAGDEVSLAGFGKFSVAQRSGRQGRNPQTGATMYIPATRAPKFSAALALKRDVKEGAGVLPGLLS